MHLCFKYHASRCHLWRICRAKLTTFVCCAGLLAMLSIAPAAAAKSLAQAAAQTPATRPVGTIKSINGKTIVLTTDAGAEITIQVQDDTKLVRIAPGEKDLKNAAPLQFEELQVGDRILVRGALGPDGKTLVAASVIAMKQADLAAKQAHEREEWQRHGVGGLVTKVDTSNGTIIIATNAVGAAKDVTVHVTKQTVLRRYATNSVKFDDAKPAPIEDVKAGDQLRARGTRSPDGAELTADEVVSGSFRNIAGTINGVDASAGTIAVNDLITKKPVTVKIGADAQLRKLPPMMAQMIAARLKGGTGDTPTAAGGATGASQPQGAAAGQGSAAGSAPGSAAGAGGGSARPAGSGGQGGAGGRGDLQQMLSRLPAVTLADLQKGDAVMIVSTEGTQDGGVTAITLLTGVDAILQASPSGGASSILTPWSLGGAPGGDAAP
jgi:hypothetical protein